MIRWEAGLAVLAGAMFLVGAIVSLLRGKRGGATGLAFMAAVCGLIVLPGLGRDADRPALNESAAMSDARNVMSSEETYRASNGGSYGQLPCLAAPVGCGFPEGTPSFIDSQAATLTPLRGYTRSFVAGVRKPGVPDAKGIASDAFVLIPTKPGVTGTRGFCSDDTGRTCVTRGGTAPAVRDGRCAEPCTALQ